MLAYYNLVALVASLDNCHTRSKADAVCAFHATHALHHLSAHAIYVYCCRTVKYNHYAAVCNAQRCAFAIVGDAVNACRYVFYFHRF